MPYIADYLWQDVLAAGRKLIDELDLYRSDPGVDLAGDKLEAALDVAEGGSDTGGGSCATG